MIKSYYSKKDQSLIDGANEAIESHTKMLIKYCKDRGYSAKDTLRVVADCPQRKLLLKSLGDMTMVMIPTFTVKDWR